MKIIEHLKNCPKCDSEEVKEISYSDDVDYKGFTLDVEDLHQLHCASCNHLWVEKPQHIHNLEQIKSAYSIVRDKKREAEGLLTATQIAEIRTSFYLNQRQAAELFGGGFNSFNKYESGEVLQSFAMDRLLRMTKAFGSNAIEFLRNPHTKHYFNVTKVINFGVENKVYLLAGIIGSSTFGAATKRFDVTGFQSKNDLSTKRIPLGASV